MIFSVQLMKYFTVSLPQMLHDILGHDHIQWNPLSIRHYSNFWTYYRTWPYYWFWPHYQISGGFHRMLKLANRGRLLLRTPGPVKFGTCICSNVETNFSWAGHVFRLNISNIPQYFYFYYWRLVLSPGHRVSTIKAWRNYRSSKLCKLSNRTLTI